VCDLETSRMGAPYIYDISHLRVKFRAFQKNILLYKETVFENYSSTKCKKNDNELCIT